ncbi:hypothetical protein PENTCL1PPCAC_24226, partial [Pristionchus entomophagus]
MMDVGRSRTVRPSKRDPIAIKDGESTNDQPIEKIVKRETESIPSSEVVELPEEVAKWKDKFERACRANREAEVRIEFLENLLETKREANDGDFVMSLEKFELAREIEALKNEMAMMRKEHNDKMAGLITRASDRQAKDHAR